MVNKKESADSSAGVDNGTYILFCLSFKTRSYLLFPIKYDEELLLW